MFARAVRTRRSHETWPHMESPRDDDSIAGRLLHCLTPKPALQQAEARNGEGAAGAHRLGAAANLAHLETHAEAVGIELPRNLYEAHEAAQPQRAPRHLQEVAAEALGHETLLHMGDWFEAAGDTKRAAKRIIIS